MALCWICSSRCRPSNIEPLLSVARDNFGLTEYLIEQLLQSESHRLAALDEYFPNAKAEDWRLQVAGQRVRDHQARRQTRRPAGVREPNSSPRRTARSSLFSALRLERRRRRSSRSAFWKSAFPTRIDARRLASQAEGDHPVVWGIADRGCRFHSACSGGHGSRPEHREHLNRRAGRHAGKPIALEGTRHARRSTLHRPLREGGHLQPAVGRLMSSAYPEEIRWST